MDLLLVAIGGACGAVMRYLISCIPCEDVFPTLTLFTNFLGAVLIGILFGIASDRGMDTRMQLFLKTGFCGGFTTFSTFSLEAYRLFADGKKFMAISYSLISVAGCILGVQIGLWVAKGIGRLI